MKVVLKADDLAGYPGKDKIVPKRWQQFVDIIEKYNIKATIGIIGNSLIFDDKEYFDWIKKYNNSLIEFWNHGFLHRQFNFDGEIYQEFKNTTMTYQKQLIEYTNKLAKDKLDIEFKTFGAPYNAVDENSIKALNETNLTHIFFGFDSFNGKNLTYRIDIEKPTHIVNVDNFKKSFKLLDYAVLQVHPNSWDKNSFSKFENIVKFLIDKNISFCFAKDI